MLSVRGTFGLTLNTKNNFVPLCYYLSKGLSSSCSTHISLSIIILSCFYDAGARKFPWSSCRTGAILWFYHFHLWYKIGKFTVQKKITTIIIISLTKIIIIKMIWMYLPLVEQRQRHPKRAAEDERGEARQDAVIQQQDNGSEGNRRHAQQHVGRPGASGCQHSLLQLWRNQWKRLACLGEWWRNKTITERFDI